MLRLFFNCVTPKIFKVLIGGKRHPFVFYFSPEDLNYIEFR
jgi:hypothetical protein